MGQKGTWSTALKDETKISRSNFTELFDEISPLALTPSNIKARFKSTGIYPINHTKYPDYFAVECWNPIGFKIHYQKELLML